jgi:hypothetical protein
MKQLSILLALALGTSLLSNDLLWVNEQVEAIKPPRKGMDTKELSQIKDPFVFLKKEEKKESAPSLGQNVVSVPTEQVKKSQQPLQLSVILNNSAMINNSWYKKGDKVRGYTLAEVNRNSVLLTSKKKKLLLSTKSSNKNLKFNNK